MLRWTLLVAVTTTLVAWTGDANQKEQDSLQGTWKVAELLEKGEKLPAKQLEPVEIVIFANRLTINDEGKFREEITFKIDAAMKPKAVDFAYSKGPNTGRKEPGIYKMDGDTLTICVNEGKDGKRPTEFASTATNGCYLVVLKKTK